MNEHTNTVNNMAEQIKSGAGMIQFVKDLGCCLRPKIYSHDIKVNISGLNNILQIDVDKKEILLEPLVTMEQCYLFSSKYKLGLPVVTEFKHMTIGGAIIGLAGESSSFKYGLIDESSVIEYEVITGNGEILNVSRHENSDLFNAIPGSYGSLCIINYLFRLH